MHFRMRTWFVVICLLCLLAAFFIWRAAERRSAQGRPETAPAPTTNQTTPQLPATAAAAGGQPAVAVASAATNPPSLFSASASSTNRFRYRLTNTTRSVDSLARSDAALLLR